MKKVKSLISIILTVCMIASLLVIPAAASEVIKPTLKLTSDERTSFNISDSGVYGLLFNADGGKDATDSIIVNSTAASNNSYKWNGTSDDSLAQPTLTFLGSTNDELTAVEITNTTLTVAVPTKAAFDGSTATGNTIDLDCTYTGLDGIYGGVTTPTTTWSIPDTTGVSINASTGELTVDNTCTASSVTATVFANDGGEAKTATAVVTITRAPAELTTVSKINGTGSPDASDVTVDGRNNQTVSVGACDQFGAGYTDIVTWSLVDSLGNLKIYTGVEFDSEKNYQLNIYEQAAAGTVYFKGVNVSHSAVGSFEIKRNASVVTTLVLTEPDITTYEVPTGETPVTITYTATVKDQYNDEIENQNITWTVTDNQTTPVAITGVTIANGTVSVAADAKADITDTTGKAIKVTATVNDLTLSNDNVTIKRADPVATSVAIYRSTDTAFANPLTADTIVIPTTDTANEVTYVAKTFDQYGTEITETPTLAFATADAKVTYADGKVFVAKGADKDTTYTLTATSVADNSKQTTLTITVKDISINWPTVTLKDTPVYGDKWSKIVSFSGGNATLNSHIVPGTFTLKNDDTVPNVDGAAYVLHFASTDGKYNVESAPVPVTINKATPTADDLSFATHTGRIYTGEGQYIGAVAAKDGVNGLGSIVVRYGAKDATACPAAGDQLVPGNAGTYSVWAVIGDGDNYNAASIKLYDYTIAKADITGFMTAPPLAKSVPANDAANTSIAGLKALFTGDTALPTIAIVEFGNRKTESLSMTWNDGAGTYNVKGGTYTYTGTLTLTDNFTDTADKKLATAVTVTPVNATAVKKDASTALPATLTLAKADVLAASQTLAGLGIPESVYVTYDNGVAAAAREASWDKTMSDIIDVANTVNASSGDKTIDVTLKPDTFATWTTPMTTMPKITVTITDKFPVTVSFTTEIADVTYGTALATPVAAQTEIANGTDGDAGFTYTYYTDEACTTKTTVAGSGAESEGAAPKNAGSYWVKAALDSDTHSGSATDAFTIAQKTVTISWSEQVYVYTKEAKGPTATVTGLVGEDICSATVVTYTGNAFTAANVAGTASGAPYNSTTAPTNAGIYTAAVATTGLSNANYKLDDNSTKGFTIARADREITWAGASEMPIIDLYGDTLTGNMPELTFKDLDSSAVVTYISGATAKVTVNNAGRLTAVANATGVNITANIAQTVNYLAEDETVATVRAVVNSITGVEVTPSGIALYQDNATRTLKLNGYMKADEALTINLTTVRLGGVTSSATASIEDVNAEKLAAGTTVDITLAEGITLTYTIDTSGVVLLPANVELAEATPATTNETDQNDVGAALADPRNTTTGLAAAAAAVVMAEADGTTLPEGATKIKATVNLKIEATGYDTTATPKTFTLELTPQVTYQAVNGSNRNVGDPVTEELPNSALKSPVWITIALPAGFVDSTDAKLFAKHTMDGGAVEYIPVVITQPEGAGTTSFATWYQLSFSEVELFADDRTGTIEYHFNDGAVQRIEYDAADLTSAQPTDTKSGNTFNGWDIGGTTYKTLTDALLTALSTATGQTLSATPSFTPQSGGGSVGGGGSTESYTIKASAGENGKIDPAGEVKVDTGAEKTFAINANEGYEIKEILVDGKAVTTAATYTFKDVKADHTISASFKVKDSVADKFTDVKGHWAFDAIKYNLEKGYMKGMSDTTFEPETEMNRAMIVTMLYRIEGEPDPNDYNSFSDVEDGVWYTNAIIWAFKNKIVDGYGGHIFAPMDTITRQQLATILYRYANYKKLDVSKTAELTKFTDAGQVASWAVDGMKWAVAESLVTGRTEKTLVPYGTAKRCEVATIIMRYFG